MKFLVTGVNHRTAPVELRERIAVSTEEQPAVLAALRTWPAVREALVLSTCNRAELFVAYNEEVPDLAAFLTRHFPVGDEELRAHIYQHRDAEAVRHLFRVAASLDSMVVGEPQILGQVKAAFAHAREAGAIGRELDRLMQSTLAAAKRVRSETAVGANSVSIASVAVDLALKIFGSLAGQRVLLVGAGKMGELAARHLLAQGAGAIAVTNRTRERAERVAQGFGGQVLPYEQLLDRAAEADILITSTGSHEFVFRREDGPRLLAKRRGRPMFFIDIAVPRDVDPEMNRVDGVFLYDIDDLQSVAADNLADRSKESMRAEQMHELEVNRFVQRTHALDAVPTLIALQENAETMRRAELRRFASRLEGLTPDQREAVEALTRGLANKFLHAPMQALRAAAQEGDDRRMTLLQDTFRLKVETAAALSAAEASEIPEEQNLEAERR